MRSFNPIDTTTGTPKHSESLGNLTSEDSRRYVREIVWWGRNGDGEARGWFAWHLLVEIQAGGVTMSTELVTCGSSVTK